MLSIIGSVGKITAKTGGVAIGFVFRRRRSTGVFSRRLQQMGISETEVDLLAHDYGNMVRLPPLRQLLRRRSKKQ